MVSNLRNRLKCYIFLSASGFNPMYVLLLCWLLWHSVAEMFCAQSWQFRQPATCPMKQCVWPRSAAVSRWRRLFLISLSLPSVILCHAFNCRNTSFPSLWAAERTGSICRGWRATLRQWVAHWHRQVKINIFITFSLLNIFPHLSVAKIGGPRTFLTNDAAVISL